MRVLERENPVAVERKESRKDSGKETALFYFFLFLAGCLVGWIYEEIFYLVTEGILEKRGFLYGPYLPVYGFGALLMQLLLKRFKGKPAVVFLLSAVITGVLEYITGVLMWAVWHRRWWDYTGLFWNIDGYVCLRSVLSFAVGGLILLYILEPLMRKAYQRLSRKALHIAGGGFAVLLFLDCIFSFLFRNPIG